MVHLLQLRKNMWGRLLRVTIATVALVGLAGSCSCNLDQCSKDLDCRPGFVCDEWGDCIVPGCTSDNQCGHGSVCTASYKCEAGCRSDENCDPGFVCVSDFLDFGPPSCKPGCRSDNDCDGNQVCIAASCSPGCRSTADCGPGTFCKVASGSTFPFLNEVPSECVPGCHDDGECGANELCDDGKCLARCSDQMPCENHTACVSLHVTGSFRTDAGAPVRCAPGERCRCWESGFVSCRDDSDCALGYACSAFRCLKACTSDGDCPMDASCMDRNGPCSAGQSNGCVCASPHDAGGPARDGGVDASVRPDTGTDAARPSRDASADARVSDAGGSDARKASP